MPIISFAISFYHIFVFRRWSCGRPTLPSNAVPLHETGFNNLRFTFGSTIAIRCQPGYNFYLFPDSVEIMCNHRLQWEV